MKKSMLLIMCLCIGLINACDQKQISNVKVMSYNIRHGEGMDGVLDLSRAANVIKKQAPDLCALQEVDNYCLRSDSVAQTDYLAQKSLMSGTFSQFMNFQGGEYGMATLSAKPLISTKRLQLPDGIHEPRSSIIHEVEVAKGCTIVFANVHFDWVEGKQGVQSRLKQAKALLRFIDTLNNAVIIAGDFNCTPDSPTMQYFYKNGFEFIKKEGDNLSFQGENKAEIDHVIYRSTNSEIFKVKGIKLLEEPIVSDHRPLIAELEVLY